MNGYASVPAYRYFRISGSISHSYILHVLGGAPVESEGMEDWRERYKSGEHEPITFMEFVERLLNEIACRQPVRSEEEC